MNKEIGKRKIMRIVHSASIFQYFNAAIEFKIFEILNDKTRTKNELLHIIDLPKRSIECLIFGLKSLGLINYSESIYSNCNEINLFFLDGEWDLLKSMTSFQAKITYEGQSEFVNSLISQSNIGLRYFEGSGDNLYRKFESNESLKEVFYDYMERYTDYAMNLFNEYIKFKSHENILDVGGGLGMSARHIVNSNIGAKVIVMDIPELESDFKKINFNYIRTEKITFEPGDIFKSNFPTKLNSILFVHQLVIWNEKEIEFLLQKSYQSLSKGGRIIIFSSMANDDNSGPLMAALDSVYFKSIATGKGEIYSYNFYIKLLSKIGFGMINRMSFDTWTPHGLIVGKKM